MVFGQNEFEPNDSFGEAAELECGNNYESYIQTTGDVDWFEVTISQNGYLTVDLTSVPGNVDLNLGIYIVEDNQLVLIAADNDTNANGGQSMHSEAFVYAGTYFIGINDESSNSSNDSESYTISVSCSEDSNEVNQTIDLATLISKDTCFEERIYGENNTFFDSNDGDNDVDWFKVNINEPGKLRVVINSVPANIDLHLAIVQIKNNQPVRISDDDDTNTTGGQTVGSVAFLDAGTYYILVKDESSNATNEETYNFCINFFPNQFEINQTIDLAALISSDTCFENNIWGENECFFDSNDGDNDVDWFKVNINESGQLKVLINSVPANIDLHLAIVAIKNNQPVRISDDNDTNTSGGQSVESVAFLEAGTYYILVKDESSNATNEETYNFCINFFPNQFEINQTVDLAAVITSDTCFEENIWGENECFFDSNEGDDDQDYYEVELNSSCILNIDITSVPSNLDLNLEVVQVVNGQEVVVANDGDTNSSGGQSLSISYEALQGTYYIHIEDESHNTTNQETFNVCISCEGMINNVGELLSSKVDIFPNPFSESISINFNSETYQNANIRILNLAGQTIHTQQGIFSNDLSIPTENWNNGIYFLHLQTEEGFLTKKLIKQ